MRPTTRSPRALAGVAAGALLLAACADGNDDRIDGGEEVEEDADAEDDVAAEDDGEDDAEPDAAAGDDDGDVIVADSPLGEHVVDAAGMTLYRFEQDEPGVSNCEEDCLEAWPPLTVDDEPSAGEGIDEDLLDVIERDDDGSMQVTYDGMPLYHWAADAEPGDVDGQGVNEVWYVVAPDGSAITGAVEDAEAGEDTEAGTDDVADDDVADDDAGDDGAGY